MKNPFLQIACAQDVKVQSRQIDIINGGVAELYETFRQKLPILGGVIPLFVGGNIRAEAVEPRVNNIVKFSYSFEQVLKRGCQLNNGYYFSKKCFVRTRI